MGLKICSSASKGDARLEAWEGVGEDTLKGVIPPSLCEISQNASRKKKIGVIGSRQCRYFSKKI
jgi:hypothetical protein